MLDLRNAPPVAAQLKTLSGLKKRTTGWDGKGWSKMAFPSEGLQLFLRVIQVTLPQHPPRQLSATKTLGVPRYKELWYLQLTLKSGSPKKGPPRSLSHIGSSFFSVGRVGRKMV
jgi:hypothetical protein